MGRKSGPGINPSSAEADVPVPVLAEDMELSNEGMTVTFTLRPNVKFHPIAPVNGRVMDIDDWKTTLERFLELSAQREPLSQLLARVEYPDARHMVWHLNFPYAPLTTRIWSERFAFQVIPKELNRDAKLVGGLAIGTGYKMLDRHEPSVTMEYRKHAAYWGGDPFIDRWHFPIIPEYANRYSQFVAQSTITFSPNARDVLGLAKDVPQAVIVGEPPPDDNFQRLRFGREEAATLPTKDPRVRIALRRATNYKGIGEFLGNKQQFEAAGIPVELRSRTHVTAGPRYWLDPEKGELGQYSANYLYDPSEAKKLATAAGFSEPIELNYWILPSGGELPETQQLTVDSLNQSGVFRMNVKLSPNTVAHRDCRSLGQCSGLVQSSISEHIEYVLRDQHSAGPRPGGEPAYPNAEYDRLADQYRRELDPEKANGLLKDIQLVQAQHFTTIPFIHQYTSFGFRWPWLHNINYGHEGQDGRPIWGGHKQWLDADMPRRSG
jgi:peptide/nickel transport system substrate-binding protein